MDIHQIRNYFVEQHTSSGYEPDDYRITSVPKHIRYLLTKQVISLKPTEEMITLVFKEVMKLYFESLSNIVAAAYRFDESRDAFEEEIETIIRNTPKKLKA